MYLYVFEGYKGGPERQQQTEELVIRAVERFVQETGLQIGKLSREICREEKGKPFFKELPIQFSVSHTEDLWVCLMSDKREPVGVDIQIIKETRQERIADRYFMDDEKEYMREFGDEGFFRIWVRKEAYAKFTGKGITKELSMISTLNNEEVEFIDFDIKAGVKGTCCVKEKGELCIRMI